MGNSYGGMVRQRWVRARDGKRLHAVRMIMDGEENESPGEVSEVSCGPLAPYLVGVLIANLGNRAYRTAANIEIADDRGGALLAQSAPE